MPALILTSRQLGETNRMITFLTPAEGVQQAVLYGGRKNKLRALVSPWHRGMIWLYTDPVKNSTKITDFDAQSYHTDIRMNLDKTWAASVCSEIIIKTEAAGEFAQCWYLANGFFDGLELCREQDTQAGLLRFIWRYLGLLGQQTDCRHCIRCEEVLDTAGSRYGVSYYSPSENGFICGDCCTPHENTIIIEHESRHYLASLTDLSPAAARAIPLSPQMFQELRQLLFILISSVCGGRLKSLECTAVW